MKTLAPTPTRHRPATVLLALAAALLAALPPAVRAAEPATFDYVTRRGDTLIGLGRRLLIEPRRWPEIGRLNRIPNPDLIPTGSVLRIPVALMRSEPMRAEVLTAQGGVESGGTGLAAGATLREGDELRTGADGYATVKLVDGTLLRLQPDSRARLEQARQFPAAQASRAAVRLDGGRLDVAKPPAATTGGRAGLEVRTPQGVLGVRGTEFRVQADTAAGITRGEVLSGRVAVSGAGADRAVEAGFGSLIEGGRAPTEPVRLIAPPDLSALPALQEQILVRVTVPAVDGAAGYRAQARPVAAPELVAGEVTSATPELRLAGLPDGDYLLRVRAADARGLEGREAEHRFRLKARPEPPLPSAPPPGDVQHGTRAELGWTVNPEAASVRLQLARVTAAGAAPDFAAPLRDLRGLTGGSTVLDTLTPGRYAWRLASVRGADDQGPWGPPRAFEVRPAPAVPPAPQVGDRSLRFAWAGEPGQTFEFQVARDPQFSRPVVDLKLDKPEVELPRGDGGRYYVRLRARDPDGYLGPWAATQQFDLPACLRSGNGDCVRGGDGPVRTQP